MKEQQARIPSILILDDEPAMTAVVAEYLKVSEYYNVFWVHHGDEAKAFLEKNLVDVVITDVYHPGLNGLELTQWVTAHLNAEVIIVTGYRGTKPEDALAAGAKAFFYKPVKLDEIGQTLSCVVKNRRL